MKSTIKLKFETSDPDKSTYSLSLNTIDPDMSSMSALAGMNKIVSSNAIEGVDLVAPLSAYIYNVTKTTYDFSE